MALNPDSMNSFDDIANIIPSPINNCNKELVIDDESKLGKIDKEIDSFGDISGINKENNEIINDNSLLVVKKNKSPKRKEKHNLELKIKNFFENSKINELFSSSKNNNLINLKNNLKNNRLSNDLDKYNIRNNNEKKYFILFDKNKKLDINSLREEYTKLKNDKNIEGDIAKDKKFSSIFVDNNYEKRNTDSININFDGLNNRRKTTNYKYEYDYNNYFKTNNNSKEKKEKSKFSLYSNDIFKNNNKSSKSDILFNLNFKYKNNNNNNKNDYISKSIKTYNTIFNSLRKINSTINSKDENDSWLLNSNIKNKIDIYHSNNNLSIKNNHQKNKTVFDKLKLNKNMANNLNFQYVTPKSNFMHYKNINKNNNKADAINRYNFKKNNYYYYNLTNEENKNDNLNLNLYSFKKEANGSSKIIDNNILDKFSNNFDAIFNLVESKVKKKSNKINRSNYQEFNSKYKGKIYFKKLNTKLINPKLLSISQNAPKRSHLNELFKENKNNYLTENHFNFPKNKFDFIERLSEEKSPFKPFRSLFNKEKKYNNFEISDFSYNNGDNLNFINNRRKLINLF